MRGKISSVARMSRMYTTLREESEMLLKIKNICPDGKLPRGILLEGKPAIKNGNTFALIIYSSQAVLFSKGIGQGQREKAKEEVRGGVLMTSR